MTRDFQINGPCMVEVKGGAQYSGGPVGVITELGLTSEPIRVSIMLHHRDKKADDFPDTAPEVLFNSAEARIRMKLIHCDGQVLDVCLSEAMGGGANRGYFGFNAGSYKQAGTLPPAGMPMGGMRPLFASGSHLISLNLSSLGPSSTPQFTRPDSPNPYRFPTCYLADSKEFQLGVGVSEWMLTWRAFPYKTPVLISLLNHTYTEVLSSGAILFDRVRDS